MNRTNRLAAATAALALWAALASPASAQYANAYQPPKILKQGTTTLPIAGSGTVVVQVEVNANGAHKAVRVLKSTNHADDAAALDIANHSTYRRAMRGNKPVTAYYDFTLRFTGKSVGSVDVGASGPTAQFARMIHAGNYAGAKTQLTQYLATNPADTIAQQELGAADYFLNDYAGAAAAFSKVTGVTGEYKDIAAHAYAAAAVDLETSAPSLAMTYGKQAVALEPTANSYYALGAADLGNNAYADAAAALKKARDLAFADSKTAVKAKVNLDTALFQAYLGAGDQAQAEQTANEIKRLDPGNTVVARVMGNHYLSLGGIALKAGKTDEALADFDKAAAVGDPAVTVTAYLQSAFAISGESKPDYAKMKAYADKALAMQPASPQANFAEGIALAGEWATGGNADIKKQAQAYLSKADDEAKAAGDSALATQIESFVKNTFKK